MKAITENGLINPRYLTQVGSQVWVVNEDWENKATISRFNSDGSSAGSLLSGNGLSKPGVIKVIP